MNNIKLKALRQTLGFCAIAAILSTILVYIISFIGVETAAWIFIIGLFGVGFYLMYSINLSRLQYEEKFPNNE